jgi:membrane protein YdbS with pleckstrin-like domain
MTAPRDTVQEPPRTLHGRIRILWVFQTLIRAVFLGGLIGIALWFSEFADPLLGVGLGAVVLVFGTVRTLLLYRSWQYRVREESLFLHRGVFTLTETVVPYVRVQHVDTSRGPIERALGLSSLVVYTAGSRGADVTIPGLTPEQATGLQSRLKELAIESEEEAAV